MEKGKPCPLARLLIIAESLEQSKPLIVEKQSLKSSGGKVSVMQKLKTIGTGYIHSLIED